MLIQVSAPAFYIRNASIGPYQKQELILESPTNSFEYISSAEALDRLIARLQSIDQVALDTEADSMHHYQEKVCLIQMSFDGQNVIVDPLAGLDLLPLMRLLTDKSLIFHAADYDLRLLRKAYGFRPARPIFDTMLAARLVGFEEIGLAALVLRFFGVELPKEGQKADWSERPLSAALLKYASDDTYYLEKLVVLMKDQLKELGRVRWHEEWCAKTVEAASKDKKMEPDAEWRLKGVGKLKTRIALAFIKELWSWREKEAERVDRPPFKVLSSEKLIEIAEWGALHSKKVTKGAVIKTLSRVKLLPRHMPDARVQRLEAALLKVAAAPESEYPLFMKKERLSYDPEAKDLIEALKEECRKTADKMKLDPSIIAARASIESIIYHRAVSREQLMKVGFLMSWQAELVEPCVLAVTHSKGLKAEKKSTGP